MLFLQWNCAFIRDKNWLRLHSAIGRRDFDAISDYSEKILQSGQAQAPFEYEYVLGALLARNYAVGDMLDSVALVKRHIDLERYNAAPFYLRYLIRLSTPELEHEL